MDSSGSVGMRASWAAPRLPQGLLLLQCEQGKTCMCGRVRAEQENKLIAIFRHAVHKYV